MNAVTRLTKTKTLADIKADMSELFDQTRTGEVDVKLASELTNITGKFLKADALELAREMFVSSLSQRRIAAE